MDQKHDDGGDGKQAQRAVAEAVVVGFAGAVVAKAILQVGKRHRALRAGFGRGAASSKTGSTTWPSTDWMADRQVEGLMLMWSPPMSR